jgi:GT2 family glycosyltransferase
MTRPDISVVLACYNKAAILGDVLDALAQQTVFPGRFEVLVVDDGSTDDTEAAFAALSKPASFRYIHQQNQGAAVARNRGGEEAKSDLILFLDGDVIAAPDLVEQHLQSQADDSHPLVAGRLKSLPAENSNLFYEVIGFSEGFDHGDEKKSLEFLDTFTGNLSLTKDSFFQIGGFDEQFTRSGFEDTEFFYRASKMGFDLLYNPDAVGYHDSFTTFDQACQHVRSYQAYAVLMMNKHPELRGQVPHLRDKEPIHWGEDDWQLVLRKIVRQILALPPSIWLMKQLIAILEKWYPRPSWLRFMYWKVLGSYLLLGFRDGVRRYGSPFE